MIPQKPGPFKPQTAAANVPVTHRAFVAHHPGKPQEPIAFLVVLRRSRIAVDPPQRVRQRRPRPMAAAERAARIITGSGHGI